MKPFFRYIIALSALFSCLSSYAGDDAQDTVNRAIFARVGREVAHLSDAPVPELVLGVARSLMGTPYAASTLEGGTEELRIFLDKTDCILFVETCVALAWTYKGMEIVQGGGSRKSEPSYGLFCSNVRNLRYRNGVVDGYPSRLHYTSEWISQAEANGVMQEITSVLGERRKQTFSFMSTHPDSYVQLKENPENIARIEAVEKRLEAASYYFIPQKTLLEGTEAIKDGDILAFVSNVQGLDVTHVAVACSVDGEMHFVHASTGSMKVILEPRTLAAYARNGVRVIRLK